jgi:hypothetical protein
MGNGWETCAARVKSAREWVLGLVFALQALGVGCGSYGLDAPSAGSPREGAASVGDGPAVGRARQGLAAPAAADQRRALAASPSGSANADNRIEALGQDVLRGDVSWPLARLEQVAALRDGQSVRGSNVAGRPGDGAEDDLLSSYETALPHTTQPNVPRLERAILAAYLEQPDDWRLAAALGLYHFASSQRSRAEGAGGAAIEQGVLALYFLSRTRDLGLRASWLRPLIAETQARLDEVFGGDAPITSDEYHAAHVYARRTFHLNREQDRYSAIRKLLDEFYREPRNVYTAFLVTALNLWVGGEADYDDPTTLHNFVLGSYFSLHTIGLARELEVAWDADPTTDRRFRMAAELGGFSLLQRRWLATVHGDFAAIERIDEEHRQWHAIQPAFHAFTFGLPFFDEPENFAEGFAAYAAGLPFCESVPVRTCSNPPRFSFNVLGFILGFVDFALKAGDADAATNLLMFRHQESELENYSHWSLGRDAWEHRERNLPFILALYQNANPADDPLNFEMKRRKWGSNTTTCQECHQTQAKPEMDLEVEAPQQRPPPEVASVGTWPEITSSWYGASLSE